jgi:DNA-binding transcriptional LysR family regulator
VKVRGAFFSTAAIALAKAAAAGLGVTLVPRYVVADALATGELVPVLPRFHVKARPLIAVYPQAPVPPRKVQVFIEFLRQWMGAQDFRTAPARAAE